MIRIGLVGDIGSGKSYIANNFGYPSDGRGECLIALQSKFGCKLIGDISVYLV